LGAHRPGRSAQGGGGLTAIGLHWGRLDADNSEVDRLTDWLADDERDRADRFRFERDRRRFIVRRARLREILAAACGRHPAEIGFTTGPSGKPRLIGGALCFSASHSGDVWALALGERELGLDIELIDPTFDRAGTIGLFASGEQQALAAMSGQAALNAFFACWTRKEAFVKAIGLGLSHPLTAFEVSVGAEPTLLSGGEGWRLLAPQLAPGLAAAIAVTDDGSPVELKTVRH
jgi:4'-phosphopantetheinyl transferase